MYRRNVIQSNLIVASETGVALRPANLSHGGWKKNHASQLRWILQ